MRTHEFQRSKRNALAERYLFARGIEQHEADVIARRTMDVDIEAVVNHLRNTPTLIATIGDNDMLSGEERFVVHADGCNDAHHVGMGMQVQFERKVCGFGLGGGIRFRLTRQ